MVAYHFPPEIIGHFRRIPSATTRYQHHHLSRPVRHRQNLIQHHIRTPRSRLWQRDKVYRNRLPLPHRYLQMPHLTSRKIGIRLPSLTYVTLPHIRSHITSHTLKHVVPLHHTCSPTYPPMSRRWRIVVTGYYLDLSPPLHKYLSQYPNSSLVPLSRVLQLSSHQIEVFRSHLVVLPINHPPALRFRHSHRRAQRSFKIET